MLAAGAGDPAARLGPHDGLLLLRPAKAVALRGGGGESYGKAVKTLADF